MPRNIIRERLTAEIRNCCTTDDLPEFRKWTDVRNDNEWTELLSFATEQDAPSIARYCLEQGAKPCCVLSTMAGWGSERVHRVLVEHGVDVDEYIEIHKSALAAAVTHNNLNWARFCLEHGADPNMPKLDDYRSLLTEAAGRAEIEIESADGIRC